MAVTPFRKFFEQLFASSERRARPITTGLLTSNKRPSSAVVLQLQPLEDRCLLAAFSPLAATPDGDAGSLRDAIQTANSNGQDDTITLEAGTYRLDQITSLVSDNTATLGDLDLTESGTTVTIVGQGVDETFVEQTQLDRVFQILAGVTVNFQDLTITGGTARENGMSGQFFNIGDGDGGGILNAGTANLTNVQLLDNVAIGEDAGEGGGGLFNTGRAVLTNSSVVGNSATGVAGSGGGLLNGPNGRMVLQDTTVTANTANRAGGGIEDNSSNGTGLRLFNVTLTNNNAGVGPIAAAAPGNGGGLHISGTGNAIIDGGQVAGNVAASEGGGLWNSTGTMTIRNGTVVQGNTASGDAADNGGGGVFNNGGTINITDASIRQNTAGGTSGSGGGLLSTDGVLRVIRSSVVGNFANRAGGAVEIIDGRFYAFQSDLSSNIAGPEMSAAPGNGGALHVSGMASTVSIISESTVSANTAALEGGGLWNQEGSTLTVVRSSVNNNIARGDGADDGGGGIFNNGGSLVLRDSFVDLNSATGMAGSGGGIFSTDGDIAVTRTSVDGNTANRAGGGIEIVDGTLVYQGGSLSGNNAGFGMAAPGNGGGLHVTGMNGTSVRLFRTDVIGNSAASEGGGLWNQAGSEMTVSQSQITGNRADGDDADNGGGGIFNNGGTLTVIRTNVANNVAGGTAGSGGGIFSTDGDVELLVARLQGNVANRAGGGIEVVDGSFEIFSSILVENVAGPSGSMAPGNGGALHVSGTNGTNVVVTDTSVLSNVAASEGGGLWNQAGSSMFVRNSFVSNNIANGTGPDNGGGGLFNNGGSMTVFMSTVSRNMSTSVGGGIANLAGSDLLVTRSSVNDNVATGFGGGIYNDAELIVADTNIVRNSASQGGGVYDDDDASSDLGRATLTSNTPDDLFRV